MSLRPVLRSCDANGFVGGMAGGRWRMRGRPRPGGGVVCDAFRRTDADIGDIHNREPVAAQLSNLLGVHLEQQRDFAGLLVGFGLGVNVGEFDGASGNRGQNAHQGALRIAIVNVKTLHICSPRASLAPPHHSSSKTISDNAAPAGTMGKTLASGWQSKTSNSSFGESRKRSSKSPV